MRIAPVSKEVRIIEIEDNPDSFGSKVNESFFKLSDAVKALIKKFNLYKFDQSTADLKGLDRLPVKRGSNEDFNYEGCFMGSKIHGKGHMLTKSGDFYVVPFLDGEAKGTGAVYFANGNYFFGRLNKGQLDSGKMSYADGTSYIGDFRNNLRHGRGTHQYKDGSKYEGSWNNDVEHGVGRLIIDGLWDNGKRTSPPGVSNGQPQAPQNVNKFDSIEESPQKPIQTSYPDQKNLPKAEPNGLPVKQSEETQKPAETKPTADTRLNGRPTREDRT